MAVADGAPPLGRSKNGSMRSACESRSRAVHPRAPGDSATPIGCRPRRRSAIRRVRLHRLPMDDPRLATMAPDELRVAMRTLGYRTQSDLAAAIGVSRSAASLWLEGKVGVPRPVAMLLRMLIAAQRRQF